MLYITMQLKRSLFILMLQDMDPDNGHVDRY